MSVPIRYTNLFINGRFVPAVSGKTFGTVNAATGEVIAQVAEADAADVDIAARAAREALEKGPWATMTPNARGRMIHKYADLIEQHAQDLAALESLDNGKPVAMAANVDVPMAVNCFRYYAGFVDKIYGETIPSNGPFFSYTIREPVGVCASILPWNFPILMAAWKMGPALACGNVIIVKPAEQTPLTTLYLAELANQAGFPPGVVQVLPGYGPTAGAALCRHPRIDKVGFTGSVETGSIVHRLCAEANLKRCTLELGGKSANIVFPDVRDRLADVVEKCHQALFFNQGQVCCAGSRLFVHEDIYDEFVKLSVERAQRRRVGDPAHPETEQGPQVDKDQFEKILSYIEAGKREGASLLCGGKRVGDRGYFVEPTIFADVKDTMSIAREEIFGPVLAIMKFKTAEEVIARANETPFGLAAAVWTSNVFTMQKVSRELKAGTVWVNCYNVLDHVTPFGGYKDSGIGRELGSYVINHYTEVKTIVSSL
jgi:aldehyde dehydrogenase (NAD+)